MCQLSEFSKAGTKQNSTRIVDGCFFSTGSSFECRAKSRTCGFASFCGSVFSAFRPLLLSACGVK